MTALPDAPNPQLLSQASPPTVRLPVSILESSRISNPTVNMSFWKAAGLTYNRYLAVSARAVRRSLKEGPRAASERRGQMDLKFAKWENGKQGEAKSLAQGNQEAIASQAESK